MGATLFNSTEYISLTTTNPNYVTDLYEAYLQRAPDQDGYAFWLGGLNGGASRANLRQGFADSLEFHDHVSALCGTVGVTGGGMRYVLSDVHGSSRAVMNNNGVGTSTVIARHDYLPAGRSLH
ncbi:MAG TPA: DUF4214 domain-containing protein [Pyrinomonadaceae bacterium]|nr:DUF4214 domain-containing protein [Pyrinomonadaceae bacterium]